MARVKLPTDSTIRSVATLLDRKDAYVSGAFGNAHREMKKAGHGGRVRIRIGITGTGIIPNYRTETVDESGEIIGLPVTFRGDNHGPLFDDNEGLDPAKWSTTTMTFEELRDYLAEIRGIKPKG